MTVNAALPSRSMSLPGFLGTMVVIWAAATGFVFALALFLRWVSVPLVQGWFWLLIALFGLPLFYWLAGTRWPSSSHVARFGFALGSAAINCVLAIYTAFAMGTLIYGG